MQTPWVFNVPHFGGMYRVLDPLSPAICSTWYRVILSLKSEKLLNKSMTFSGGIPVFVRKEVSVNLPMCERWRPFEIAWCRVFMQGGKAVCMMVFGKPSVSVFPIFSLDNLSILCAISVILSGNLGISVIFNRFSICLRTSSLNNLAISFLVK